MEIGLFAQSQSGYSEMITSGYLTPHRTFPKEKTDNSTHAAVQKAMGLCQRKLEHPCPSVFMLLTPQLPPPHPRQSRFPLWNDLKAFRSLLNCVTIFCDIYNKTFSALIGFSIGLVLVPKALWTLTPNSLIPAWEKEYGKSLSGELYILCIYMYIAAQHNSQNVLCVKVICCSIGSVSVAILQ